MITIPLADLILAEAQKYVGLRETEGNNRSSMIDLINLEIGSPLGAPYCLAGLLHVLKCVENEHGIIFDIPRTAGTQLFWKETRPDIKRNAPERAAIAIFQSMNDSTKGHAALCSGGANNANYFSTIEFNTSSAGSRDGDGVYEKRRSLNSNGSLNLLGFVSVVSSIKSLSNEKTKE